MCGIIGYAGNTDSIPILLDALKKLEYRGYDSSGVAIIHDSKLNVVKELGEIRFLENKLNKMDVKGTVGISHTRWATHGVPAVRNAHPHFDCGENVALVHNGIIENYQTLREELVGKGHKLRSETDTEVIAHLIEEAIHDEISGNSNDSKNIEISKDEVLFRAVRAVVPLLEGAYALVVVSSDCRSIIGVREKSPLVIGRGNGENFFASDVSALLKYTNEMIYLNDGDIVKLDKDEFQIISKDGEEVDRKIHAISWSPEDAQKGGYEHFMLKEIHEQTESIQNTLMNMAGDNIHRDPDRRELLQRLSTISNIEIIACGTSYNAGMIGKYFIEKQTGIPTVVTHASEYRYSAPLKHTPLFIAISQSGETADTLAAMREAKNRGSLTLAVTNVVGSTITREADFTLFTRSGPEIGVAATKTFTAQIMVLFMMAIQLARVQRRMGKDISYYDGLESQLITVPRLIKRVLSNIDSIQEVAEFLATAHTTFYIGRNINYPTAEEGALKIKEISYIHAEAYPAGELKHGPLALLSPETPVIALISDDHVREKVYSNVGEVCARSAPVIIIAPEGDEMAFKYTDRVLTYPPCPPEISPLPISVILQLLAYYTAKVRGCPIDKPRNLAKSVTVE